MEEDEFDEDDYARLDEDLWRQLMEHIQVALCSYRRFDFARDESGYEPRKAKTINAAAVQMEQWSAYG
eukprot:2717896-Pyramimonas_sp.AAC.1